MTDEELLERLLGVFHNYRVILVQLTGNEYPAFVIDDMETFRCLYDAVQRTWEKPEPPPPMETLTLNGEDYDQFRIHGMRIRVHIPGAEHRRQKEEMQRAREEANYVAKVLAPQGASFLTEDQIRAMGFDPNTIFKKQEEKR